MITQWIFWHCRKDLIWLHRNWFKRIIKYFILLNKATWIINLLKKHLLGIEDFFEENTHGILVSDPLTLAIWEETISSDPLIFIFDPNPRSPTGMPLFTGTACLVSFVNANLAADHIISCIIQPELKNSTFTIFPVEIVVGGEKTSKKSKRVPTKSEVNLPPRCSKSAVDQEKRTLRKIVSSFLRYCLNVSQKSSWLFLIFEK